MMYTLDSKAKDIEYNFNKAKYGIDQKEPRWKTCLKEVGFGTRAIFKHAVGSMYVKHIFDGRSKKQMGDMIGNKYQGYVHKLRYAFFQIFYHLPTYGYE